MVKETYNKVNITDDEKQVKDIPIMKFGNPYMPLDTILWWRVTIILAIDR